VLHGPGKHKKLIFVSFVNYMESIFYFVNSVNSVKNIY